MRTPIGTNRLSMRPFGSSDAEAAFAWFGDPMVMRFTPTGPDASIEHTKTRLAKYQEHQAAHGFTKWIILDRSSETSNGDAGLLVLEEYGWIDFGFRLALPHWGKGLATEAGSAWVRVAFGELRLNKLKAMVHPENVSSIHVLTKLGFTIERRDILMGMEAILFSLNSRDARLAENYMQV